MKLHLIRHGETNWNAERRCQGQSDSELNETGKTQAREMQPVISTLDIGAIYCSSSYRTRQTCALLAGHLPYSPVYLDSLREINLGPFETRLWSDIIQIHPEQAENFREYPELFKVDGAETVAGLQQRGVAAIESIIADRAAENILIVSHGALLKSILLHYANVPISQLWCEPDLHNCAHSILQVDGSRQVSVTQVADIADYSWPA